ncbi:hypothetical protein Bca4012_009354 [Brassica carinata]
MSTESSDQTSLSNEFMSPYKLHPSYNPGALITSVLLRGDNYSEWATELTNSLMAKQKFGFIDGSITKPAANPDQARWIAANSMIVGWIRTSIDPAIRSTVTHVSDASKLWDSLKRRFSVNNGVRKHLLQDEITHCRQEGKPVLEYFGKLSKLWKELQNLNSSRSCSCEAAPDIEKEREDSRVHKFLFGLDDARFSNIRSQIINEDPLPDLNSAYSRVIREEQHHLTVRSQEVKNEAIGFNVKTETPTQQSLVAAANASRPRDRSDPPRFCTHCNKKGHDVSECFSIHGYPDWYVEQYPSEVRGSSSRGGRSTQRGRGRVNVARNTSVTGAENSSTLPTSDQVAALINLLQNQQTKLTTDRLSGPFYEDPDWSR